MRPSLTNRLRIGFAILIALIVAVSVLGVGRLFQVRKDFEDRSARSFQLSVEAEQLRSAFILQQSALARQPSRRSRLCRSAFDQAVAESNQAASDARALAEEEPSVLPMLDQRIAAEQAWRQQLALPLLRGRRAPPGEDRRLTEAVVNAGEQLRSSIERVRDESREQSNDETRKVVLLVIAGLAGALLAAIVLFSGLVGSMRAPLSRLVEGARRLAGGDLSTRVEAGGPAEITTLGQAFNEMAAALERDDRMKDDFLLTVSHELRTPVTSVKGFAEMLATQENTLTESQREAIDAIVESAADLSTLIDDLLDLARSDAGRLELRRRPTAVGEVLDRVARQMRPRLEERGQELMVSASPDLPTIEADPERLAQVLTNLLTNANKYAAEGSEIRLSAARGDGQLVIDVADDGPGIPAGELPHVFERFWRAESGESQRVGGTGLGLAIAKSLVELHAGRISVHSPAGSGAHFRVTLPVRATVSTATSQGSEQA